MTTVRILPGAVRGTALAPPSKSYTHRALIAAHLAGRRYLVLHPLDADDTRATARALRRLGSRVRWEGLVGRSVPSPQSPGHGRRSNAVNRGRR